MKDFAIGLSILLKGSDEDKMKWIFQVYDVNKDGILTRAEFRDVTASVRIQICFTLERFKHFLTIFNFAIFLNLTANRVP